MRLSKRMAQVRKWRPAGRLPGARPAPWSATTAGAVRIVGQKARKSWAARFLPHRTEPHHTRLTQTTPFMSPEPRAFHVRL